MIRIKRLLLPLIAAFGVASISTGCTTIKESYYLSTYDPATKARNYFRLDLRGFSSLSKIKFSVGFYDKTAVERLFGEQVLQREYLSTRVDVFDSNTGKALDDLSAQLDAARAGDEVSKLARLRASNATVAGLLMKYEIRLYTAGKLDAFQSYLTEIEGLHVEAEGLLSGPSKDSSSSPNTGEGGSARPSAADLARAENRIQRALVGLHAIRVAVDGEVLVRFFDGAGNELDVASSAQVIFVANDVSRFAEAIRQLAEDNQIQADVLDIVLGERLADAQRAAARAADSDARAAEVSRALEELLDGLPANTNADATVPDKDTLERNVLRAAAAIAEGPSAFDSADDIRNYLEGLEQ